MNELRLVPRVRRGWGKTRREFLDIVIDGRSLIELADPQRRFTVHDTVTVLDDRPGSRRTSRLRQLTLLEPGELPNDRRPLLQCSECTSLFCGVLSARVEREDNRIVWTDFGWEPALHFPAVPAPEDLREGIDREMVGHLGEFAFVAETYLAELSLGAARLAAS